MTTQLFVAPAGAGKTAFVLDLVREAAQELRDTPHVVVPTRLQIQAWRRRLAHSGGAIGVRPLTFDRLYAECLDAAGEAFTQLTDPVQYRLIRAVVDDLPLSYYAPLSDRPGFIQILQGLIGELKAGRIFPQTFADAATASGGEPRLAELAQIYEGYQAQLQSRGWADWAGVGWLAVTTLEQRAPQVARGWPLLAVDGFDNFTSVQLDLLRILSTRVQRLVITLTGTDDGSHRALAHSRFARTRRELEEALGIEAQPLPRIRRHAAPTLSHIEANLFRAQAAPVDGGTALELIEAPDRAGEVRAALRWIKARLVEDRMAPNHVALLARDLAPYRPFILQTGAEFGLPLRLVDGLPLRSNPAVTALLDLVRLALPAGEASEPALPRQRVVEAWRCPYFDWSALPEEGSDEEIGISPGDADALDAAARWGRVIEGLGQWKEVLEELTTRPPEPSQDDDERDRPAHVPAGEEARALADKFRRFLRRLTPPSGQRPYSDFVGWLEDLIGPDPALQSDRYPLAEQPTALRMVERIREGPEETGERDLAALQMLKDVMRGLVWAEEALELPPVNFPRFLEELIGAVEASFYQLPIRSDRAEVLVADVIQARGLPLRAAAVLGLAEGEFPAQLSEDPLLRDRDRKRLRDDFGLPLDPSTESAEGEFFYEAVTGVTERLLLTRPRLADNGAPWQASPFWEAVRRLVTTEPRLLTSQTRPAPQRCASWPELMESVAAYSAPPALKNWIQQTEPARWRALQHAASLFHLRQEASASPFDGHLTDLAQEFSRCFGPRHLWSSSRLETYRTCPFFFFVGKVLGLEPREEPSEGLDARQLGTIYHRILERVYAAAADATDRDQLLDTLNAVAPEILDEAPQREGFRRTAWWAQTRQQILEDLRRSLEALAECQGDFVPIRNEAPFGLWGRPTLAVGQGEERFRLRGLIDRIDRAPSGEIRVIDYKTAGPWSYNNRAVAEGKKLQLPLYALAARDALGLGEPVEGFYWHVRHAEPSAFTLEKFGPEEAMNVAVRHAREAIRGAQRGHFVPQPPDDGCPSYCPAAAFCWHYDPGWGG